MSCLQDAVSVHGQGRWAAILEDQRFSATLGKFTATELACIWQKMAQARARAALAAADAARKKASTSLNNERETQAMLLAQMQQAATIHGEDSWELVRQDPRFRHSLGRFSALQLREQWVRMSAQRAYSNQHHQQQSCLISPEELATLRKAVMIHGDRSWSNILQDPRFANGILSRFHPVQLEQIWRKFCAQRQQRHLLHAQHQQQQHSLNRHSQSRSSNPSTMSSEMAKVVNASARTKSGMGAFSPEEIAKLHMAVFMYGEGAWETILNDKTCGPVFRAHGRSADDLAKLWSWISESLQPQQRNVSHSQFSRMNNGMHNMNMSRHMQSESESHEIKMLRQGVSVYGEGRWHEIKNDPRFSAVLAKYDVDVLKATWRYVSRLYFV